MIRLYVGVWGDRDDPQSWQAILEHGFPDWGEPIYEVDKGLTGVEFLRRPGAAYQPGIFENVLAVSVPLTERQLAQFKRHSDYSGCIDWDPSEAFDYWLLPVDYLNEHATIELWWERGQRRRERIVRKPPYKRVR